MYTKDRIEAISTTFSRVSLLGKTNAKQNLKKITEENEDPENSPRLGIVHCTSHFQVGSLGD